jgi:hypothetical protein
LIRSHQVYRNGKLEGVSKGWYENGQSQWVSLYKNNLMKGNSKYWRENGQRWIDGNYHEGLRHGTHRVWHKNGRIETLEFYQNGDVVGESKAWNENGNLTNHEYHGYDFHDNFTSARRFFARTKDIMKRKFLHEKYTILDMILISDLIKETAYEV